MMTLATSLTALMVFAAAVAAGGGGTFHRPYGRADADFMYNLIFCDDPQLFVGKDKPTGAVATVLSPAASVTELRRIADDERVESRVRVLAFNRLRAAKGPVPKGTLLGVIIEMPLEKGLDVLAAFTDGMMRYINQTGKMVIIESPTPAMAAKREPLLKAARVAIGRIGPSNKARLPPPRQGNVRLTFLVSDGLYFGEGPVSAIARDDIGGPILAAGGDLLAVVVDASLKK